MTKQQKNIREKWVTFKRIIHAITIERNQKIQSLQIIDNIYIYIYI